MELAIRERDEFFLPFLAIEQETTHFFSEIRLLFAQASNLQKASRGEHC